MASLPSIALVTLEYAGKTWRMSSRPVSLTDWQGKTRLYRGGLSPVDIYQEGGQPSVNEPQSQTFEVLPDASIAELTADGHLPSEMRAEIAEIDEGETDLEKRRVLLSGIATIESDGFEGKPLRLQVTADDPAEAYGAWPHSEASATDDTLGVVGVLRREAEDGNNYPTVFGQAGYAIVGGAPASVGAVPVIPILLDYADGWAILNSPWGRVDAAGGGWWTTPAPGNRLGYAVIAEGWMYPGPAGSPQRGQVTGLYRAAGSSIWTPTTCDIIYMRDSLGRIVTLARAATWIKINAGPPVTLNDDYEYSVAISPPCEGGVSEKYDRGLTGAGQIVRFALAKSSVRVDWRRTSPALAVLDRTPLAGYWNEQCEPWQWLVDNVFPLLPCSWVAGPHGVYPVIWRMDATPYDCDARLTDGLDCTIQGAIEHEGDPLSALTLDYAHAFYGGKYRRRTMWHGKPTRAGTRENTTLHLRRAQQRYGSRRGAEFLTREDATNTDMVYDDRGADRILAWKSRYHSQPMQVLRVIGDGLHHREHLAKLEPGMAVSLTSDRYSLSSRVAYVRRAGKLGGVRYADLVILSGP